MIVSRVLTFSALSIFSFALLAQEAFASVKSPQELYEQKQKIRDTYKNAKKARYEQCNKIYTSKVFNSYKFNPKDTAFVLHKHSYPSGIKTFSDRYLVLPWKLSTPENQRDNTLPPKYICIS